MATRTYTKTVLSQKLVKEIKAAVPDLLDSVSTEGESTVVLILLREPTGAEDAQLTAVINNHTPSYLEYKIWDMVENRKQGYLNPSDINFSILPLAIQKTYDKGMEDLIMYYRSAAVNADGSITYSDPVLQTDWVWTFDPVGFPIYAEERIKWYLEDDTLGEHSKVVPHYFDGLHKIRKGKDIRGTLVDDMQIPVSQMIIYNETVRRATEEANPAYQLTLAEIEIALQIGRDYLSLNRDSFSNFVEHSDKKIVTDITNSTEVFLDWPNPYAPGTDIRTYILSQLPTV